MRAANNLASDPTIDEAAIHELFAELDEVHLVAIVPDGNTMGRHFGSDRDAAVAWAAAQNSAGKNVYWTVNAVRPVDRKPKKSDILAARFVHVDIDPPANDTEWSKASARQLLQEHQHPPSFIIDSGNGLQAFWRLEEPIENWEQVEAVNLQARFVFGADACHNIDRLMRVPGLANYPNAKKQAAGRGVVIASVDQPDDGVVYSLEELCAGFPAVPTSSQSKAREQAQPVNEATLLTADDLGLGKLDKIRTAIEHPPGRDRSGDGLAVARLMANKGYKDEQILGILLNPENPVSSHFVTQRDPRRAATRVVSVVRRKGDSRMVPVKADGRRTIRLRADALHLIASEAENALIAAEAPFFVRGQIVRPIVDELPAAHGRRTKVARLIPVEADSAVDHLSRCASWEKYDGRSEDWVLTDPPIKVAKTILARDGEWRFRRLAGVITTPTLRPDGSVLASPGYDAATQLLLLDPPTLPAMPDMPTRGEALEALAVLGELLSEFPFVDAASGSAALSALITPVVRGALQVAPLHATTAPVAGSGKSYIIDLASAIATGERAPVIAAGRTEEETEKRLGAALLNGQAIVSIDNVNGDLGGDMLCQMIERPIVAVRPLGVSKLVKIESRATVYATGNNIHLMGDMVRRVILCSLDPNVERPELRKFDHDPLDMVLANRGRYIAAALTICRAYACAGFPDKMPNLASFEDWSRLVRSALVWLGKPDPVETMEAARADDPVITDLRALLTSWYTTVGSEPQTAGKIIERGNETSTWGRTAPELYQALLNAAPGRNGEANARALGRYLARHKGRIVDGLRFIDSDDSHAKQKVWTVQRSD